jgi:hypothetical protein
MDPNFSFQKSESSESEEGGHPIYFRNQITDYSETIELAPNSKATVIFGQPVENRAVYIMERRPGCDLGIAVLNDKMRHSRFAFVDKLKAESLVSFLGYYESHPLKITSKEVPEFYKDQIFNEICKIMTNLGQKISDVRFIDLAGSIDYLMNSVRQHAELMKPVNSCIIKLSPFVYGPFFEGIESPVFHIGLDRKFDTDYLKRDPNKTPDSRFLHYDLEEGAGAHLAAMTEAFSNFDAVELVIDCQVFSSEYFQGISVPFPFSFTKQEIYKMLSLIAANKEKVKFMGICHFNPAVEERRSSMFITDFLYKFIAE